MPFTYRLHQLQFFDGRTIDLPNLTVFVGPNNSGKSRLLKDVLAITSKPRPKTILLGKVATALPSSIREAAESYGIVAYRDQNTNAALNFVSPTFDTQEQRHFNWTAWPDGICAGAPDPHQFAEIFGAALTAFLSTARRLSLVEKGMLSGKTRGTLLQELYSHSKDTELTIRARVREAFPEIEIALDFTSPPTIEFRVGPDFSSLPEEPRKARETLEGCEQLDEQGDGLRSYAGIVTAMTCANRPVILIDEPEAFLHPPQAFRIGEFISSMAADNRQIVVATHSVDVLRGLVSRSANLKVVRLDRIQNTTNFATLESDEVKHLYQDPLLSSAGVLNGLFYSSVVVTEADGDSRFYSAISSKMDPARDLHFINADNKQTVPAVLNTYKKMGVRAVGILDIDVLNNAVEFNQQLDALGITSDLKSRVQAARARIEAEIQAPSLVGLLSEISIGAAEIKRLADESIPKEPADHLLTVRASKRKLGELRESASVWRRLKQEGRAALSSSATDFDFILSTFSAHGVFINPAGEMEASLGSALPWRPDKKSWFRDAMKIIPNLHVSSEDLPWKLVAEIHTFLDS